MMNRKTSFNELYESFSGMFEMFGYQEYNTATRINGIINDPSWSELAVVEGCLMKVSTQSKSTDLIVKSGDVTHSFITKSELKINGRLEKDGVYYQIIETKNVKNTIGFNKYYLKETSYGEWEETMFCIEKKHDIFSISNAI